MEDLQRVKAVLQGDTRAFASLVDRYKDFVYTLSMNLLRQHQEAEEAAQDTFLKAFRYLPRYRAEAKFSTWLYRIAYNECVTRLRKRKTSLPLARDFDEKKVAGAVVDAEPEWRERENRYEQLHEAIRQLPETDRALVMLFYFEKMAVEELSAVTGLGVSNVKTRLFRARKKLYEKLLRTSEQEFSWKGEKRK